MGKNTEPDAPRIAEARAFMSVLREKVVVAEAFEESARRRDVACITRLFGEIRYDPQYDYKKYRSWR
ncbi:type II toxin-antitoxin system VapB family antitoxin [Methanocalculus sp.]|jgi:hypothetical protein|nr:type II toxin-antitoxin system VapB family antitoxin [Methanocalculus sp.]HIJ06160.1 type II toxin-antitoxin system VapB family antitoxin [Methanocalculus sp.]